MNIKPVPIFRNPEKGVAKHPLVGIGMIKNIDVNTYPGLIRLAKTTAKTSGSTITGLTFWIKKIPTSTGVLYALDSGGQVYKSTNDGASWAAVAGETTGGAGQGLEYWKGYMVVARATRIDLLKVADDTWTNSWQANTGGADILDATQDFHTMLRSVDDCLYICCGRYVAKLKELTTFDPATSSTYSWTGRAITLPQGYNSKCLADLGSYLMIGTWFGVTSAVYQKVADIFPYFRSDLTLGVPIKIGDNGVHAFIPVVNTLYAIVGTNAKIYEVTTISAIYKNEIPNYAINILDSGLRLDVWPGAIAYHRDKILIGIDNSSAVNGNVGVWSYNVLTEGVQLEATISSGADGSAAELAIGSLFSLSNDSFLIGWKDYNAGVQGIDKKSTSSFFSAYSGYIESELIHVGVALGFTPIGSLEFFLSKPLLTGQGIKIYWRKNTYDGWTLIKTFTTTGVEAFDVPGISLKKLIYLQVKAELTSAGSDTPELAGGFIRPGE